jgi:hypothetical protein
VSLWSGDGREAVTSPFGRVGVCWFLPAAFGAALLVLMATALMTVFLVEHDTPRGLVNTLPLPRSVRPLTQVDGLNYRIHVGLGQLFETIGAPPSALASEWFKGAYHARSQAQLDRTAEGLIAVEQRSSTEQVEATLCPELRSARAVRSRSDGVASRLDNQEEVLAMAGLSCQSQ